MTSKLLLRKALRDFARMGLRAWLIYGVLAVGVAVYAGGFLAQASIFATRDRYYEELALADLTLVFSPADIEDLPSWMRGVLKDDLRELKALGMTNAVMRFISPGAIEVNGDKPLMSMEVYLDPTRLPEVNKLEIIEGRYLSKDTHEEVVMESAVAELLGYEVGDTLTLDPYNSPEKVKIVGLARTAEFLLPTANPDVLLPSKGSLVVVYRSIHKFTELFGAPMYNNVALFKAGNGVSAQEQQRVVEVSEPLVFRQVTERHGQFSYRFLQEDLKAFGIFIPVLSSIFGLVTFLVLLLSLSRLITEEQRPIGALLALGRTPREIVFAYLFAALLWGGMAAGAGIVASPVFASFVANGYANAIGLPHIDVIFVLSPILRGFALGISATSVAVLVPALRITRMAPVTAMRGSSSLGFVGLPGWLEALVRPLTRSMATRFGVRNMLRKPKLTFAVVGLIALAMALSLAFRFTNTAWHRYADYAFDHEKWDGIIAFKVPLEAIDLETIRQTPGLGIVQNFMSGFGALCDGEGEDAFCTDYRVMGITAHNSLRKFRFADGGMFESDEAPGIILNKNFNHVRPYKVGETLWLKNGTRTEKVRVAGLTSDMTIGVGYTSMAVARRLFNLKEGQASGFMATVTDDPRTVKKRLLGHEMVTYVSLKVEMRDLVSSYLEIIWSIIDIAVFVAILLAGLFMLTGLSMAILEREAEYATLRTYGYADREILRMIFVEVVASAILAIIVAVPLSYMLASYIQGQMARAWFEVPFHYTLRDYLRIIVPCLVMLPLFSMPPIRKLLSTAPAMLLRARNVG